MQLETVNPVPSVHVAAELTLKFGGKVTIIWLFAGATGKVKVIFV